MNGLGLHRIEHGGLFVKKGESLFSLRMISRDDDGNVFFRSRFLSLDLCRFEIIAFLLARFVKPIGEKSCTLSLLPILRTAKIKKNIFSLKELFKVALLMQIGQRLIM